MTRDTERLVGLAGAIATSIIIAGIIIYITPAVTRSLPIAPEARWIMYLAALLTYYIMGIRIPINAYREAHKPELTK